MPLDEPTGGEAATGRLMPWLLAGAALLVGVWVTFFDSHSIQRYRRFEREQAALHRQNDSLRHQIEALEARLDGPPADSTIERLARQEYGLSRPGETVYRVQR